ncbi:MAG: uracil-DNA glycosylase [Acidimicrobiia bacterium]
MRSLATLEDELVECQRCPRLVEWRQEVAATKRAAYADEEYWGRPVPGFGDPEGRLLILGLAPAAHGANRTGRMFTGDRSGDWLYRAMFRAGFANQAEATGLDDGLTLTDAFVTSPVKCAPPDNKPSPGERDNCRSWLDAELELLPRIQVVLCLGGYSYVQALVAYGRRGVVLPRPRTPFGHGSVVSLDGGPAIVMSYHPSQQNTFTGRLTEEMLDSIFDKAKALLEDGA